MDLIESDVGPTQKMGSKKWGLSDRRVIRLT